jgi:glycosyltransferase involved in cell wall biosynthesis
MNLAICLKSKHTNWECIIVNDGSPDDTESVVKNGVQGITDLSISKKTADYHPPVMLELQLEEIYFTFGRYLHNDYLKLSP